jgi:uncharacterized membrane-anchored protein YitT (DUF2179 family)
MSHVTPSDGSKSVASYALSYFWTIIGAFIAAFAIKVFFIPNTLIDGGTVGLAMIAARLFGNSLLPPFLLLFNLPFIYLAYRYIGKVFVIQLSVAILSFALFLFLMPHIFSTPFIGDSLEVVVIGGAILGVGLGIIIRVGGCIDGTEILGIIINRKKGFTVGQTVFSCNIFVFGLAGLAFQDWHPPLLSLITYIVVVKIMDTVIVGLDETKSVLVISPKSKEIAHEVMHQLGLGVTIMYGRGGYSGESTEILYIITERLQLADLKDLIFKVDPKAFLAIENLHEVSSGKGGEKALRIRKHIASVASRTLQKEIAKS